MDDFAEVDLISLGISAVNPDLFVAERLTREAYALVIDLFVERQVAPPTTAAQFHSAVARQHPRLSAAHADLHNAEPATSIHREPAVIFRGTRCLSCETIVAQPGELIDGLYADCRRIRDRGLAHQRRTVVCSGRGLVGSCLVETPEVELELLRRRLPKSPLRHASPLQGRRPNDPLRAVRRTRPPQRDAELCRHGRTARSPRPGW